MTEYAAVVVGRRQGVHRLDGQRSGRCNVGRYVAEVDPDADWPPVLIDAAELARIIQREPRRLCGWCYPTQDRHEG